MSDFHNVDNIDWIQLDYNEIPSFWIGRYVKAFSISDADQRFLTSEDKHWFCYCRFNTNFIFLIFMNINMF